MIITSFLRMLPKLFSSEGRFKFKVKFLARIPGYAAKGRKNPGHLTHVEGITLELMAGKVPENGTIVEVGSFKGKSAVYMSNGKKPSVKIYCVDTWNCDAMTRPTEDVFSEFQTNIKPYVSQIIPLRGRSDDMAKSFKGGIDLLWIDGDHSYEGCSTDIKSWLPFVKPGGYVCFHDYGNPCGVRQSVDEFIPDHQSSSFTIDSIYLAKLKV